MAIEIIIIAMSYILAGISNYAFYQYIMDHEYFAEISKVEKKAMCAAFASVWPATDCVIIVAVIVITICNMVKKKG